MIKLLNLGAPRLDLHDSAAKNCRRSEGSGGCQSGPLGRTGRGGKSMKILYVEVNDDNVYMLKNRLLGTLENLVSFGEWSLGFGFSYRRSR